MGEALCRVAANYPTVLEVILEQVQNAIDADASGILIHFDKKKRRIAVRDNGNGVSRDEFEEALQDVCKSKKEQGKLGRFGIGLISPLGKCTRYTFTSCPVSTTDQFREWTFATEEIRAQSKNVQVPYRERTDLVFGELKESRRDTTSVRWRTEVHIEGFTTDRLISRVSSLEALRDAVLERFSARMRRNNVALNIKFVDENGKTEYQENIRAKRFSGKSLGEMVITNPDAGKVTFNLFLAQQTTKGQHGKISVGEENDDYRFSFAQFAQSIEGLLPEEIISALRSGIFEGEILGEKTTLHASRKRFEANDALVGFCAAIETWFQKHGAKHLTAAKEARQDQRYQRIGLESLRMIESLIRDPAFSEIQSVISDFGVGTVGTGHASRPKRIVAGEQDSPAISTQGGVRTGEGIDKPRERRKPKSDKPRHHPFTVAGPGGHQRTLVKNDSLGLQFSYVAAHGSSRLWELDTRAGVLHFNIYHPVWVACDVSDRRLRQLQETVAIQALMLEALPEEVRETVRFSFDELLRPLLYVFHASPAFTLRKLSSRVPASR